MTYRVNPRVHSLVDTIIEFSIKGSGLAYSQEYQKIMKYGVAVDQYEPKFKSNNYKKNAIDDAAKKLKDFVRRKEVDDSELTPNSRTINITADMDRVINDYSDKNNVTKNLAAYRYSMLGAVYLMVAAVTLGDLHQSPVFREVYDSKPFFAEITKKRDLYVLIFNDITQNVDPLDNVWGEILAGKYGKFELKSEKLSVQTTELPKPVPKKRLTLRGGSIL